MAVAIRKTVCPVSRQEFAANAKPVQVTINGKEFELSPDSFSTGSLGWKLNEKITLKVGDKTVTVQVGLNLTIVGSKELPPQS